MDKQEARKLIRTEIAAALRSISYIFSSPVAHEIKNRADKLDPPEPKPKFKPGDLVCAPTGIIRVVDTTGRAEALDGLEPPIADDYFLRDCHLASEAEIKNYIAESPNIVTQTLIRLFAEKQQRAGDD